MTANATTTPDRKRSIEQQWIDTADASVDELSSELSEFVDRLDADTAEESDLRELEISVVETLLHLRDTAHTCDVIDGTWPRFEATEKLFIAASRTNRDGGDDEIADAVEDSVGHLLDCGFVSGDRAREMSEFIDAGANIVDGGASDRKFPVGADFDESDENGE